MKRSKRYTAAAKKFTKTKKYSADEGLKLAKGLASAKFDETIEVSIKLGVDPRHAEQMVRGRVSLPGGTGKIYRVLVFTKGANETVAKEAGADYVGLEDMIEKVKGGWLEFEVVVATPDVMGLVGKSLGKILGPKGIMPNPKSGTITTDVATTVKEIKAGKIEFRVDRYGIVHVGIGKASFEFDRLFENLKSLIQMIIRLKPATAKGQYVKGVALSSTMGPGIALDRTSVLDIIK